MWYPWKKQREFDDPIRVASFATPPPKSHHKGVIYSKTKKRWIARRYFNNHTVTLGTFKTEDEAILVLERSNRVDDMNSAAKDPKVWAALSKRSHESILENHK